MKNILESGLTFKHYKEPLLKVPKKDGFGFYGALLMTEDGDKCQCHICGKLFSGLSRHVNQAHKINVFDYREKFMLARSTALVSETFRDRLKQNTLDWIAREEKKNGKHWREKMYKKIGKMGSLKRRNHYQPKESLESKNKKGTCPDQLLAKIQEVAKKIGKTPTLHEFIFETGGQRFKHLIFVTFGSWLNALKMAKLQPREHSGTGVMRKYSDEELLEYLQIFAQENNRIPTYSDCRRGLLPTYEVFTRRFGSMPKAREIAGVERFIKN